MSNHNGGSLLGRFQPDDVVLIGTATRGAVTRSHIQDRAQRLSSLAHPGDLAFLLNDGGLASAIDFHALFESGVPFALLDAQATEEQQRVWLDRYSPELVLAATDWQAPQGWQNRGDGIWQRAGGQSVPVHPELAVLLTTSGSTGSPKFVRASRSNIITNAEQIAESLDLSTTDRGVTSLPIHYSYGMSVLTSHAIVGAPVVVSGASVIDPDFWQTISDQRVTTLAGVPQTYHMLKRLRFAERWLPVAPQLRALLQAGGHLDSAVVAELAATTDAHGGAFVVMYGQTEAVPRMACLPPDRLADKLGSAGVALTGGRLTVRAEDGSELPPGQSGHVYYQGPNVMMGYAEQRQDLSLGDVQGGDLATGDIGYLDSEGYLYLTGRSRNFAKVAGVRVSLDEVQQLAVKHDLPECVALETEPGVITLVHTSSVETSEVSAALRRLTRHLRLPARSLRLQHLPELPLLSNGKVDYPTLGHIVRQSTPSHSPTVNAPTDPSTPSPSRGAGT